MRVLAVMNWSRFLALGRGMIEMVGINFLLRVC